MTKQNAGIISNETTISRQTRNAFLTAVIFVIAATANAIVSLQISLATRSLISFVDTFVVFIFVLISISSAILIRRGEKERGVWLIIGTFLVVLAIRVVLNTGLGIIFGILAATLVPFIALLTLKPEMFNRALSVGVFTGSAYLFFDTLAIRYLPPYRQPAENIQPMIRMATITAVIVFIIFVFFLLRQSRFLLLSSKLTLSMVLIVLVPLIILGIASTVSLKNSLDPRQSEITQSKATFLAQNLNYFLRSTKNTLRTEAQSPTLVEYTSRAKADSVDDLYEKALDVLRSYRRKDIIFIQSYAILDRSGKNILDTKDENIGQDESENDYFYQVIETKEPYISDLKRSKTYGEYSLYFSVPIISEDGSNVGVLRIEYNSRVLQDYFNEYVDFTSKYQEQNYGALLSEIPVTKISPEDPAFVYLILANSESPTYNNLSATHLTTNIITPLQTSGLLPPGSTAQLSLNLLGLGEGLENRSTTAVFQGQAFPRDEEVLRPLDLIAAASVEEGQGWIVIVSQDLNSINNPLQEQRETITLITVLIAAGAAFLAYGGSRYLLAPILRLTEIAKNIAGGDLSAQVIVNTEDEIGTLGKAFNSMTEELSALIATLEERVDGRTRDLERRSQQLRAAVDVGQVAVSLRNLDTLLTQAAELISLRFGFYHVGIFLLDEEGAYAVLRASNSEGGAKMLQRNHKLKVGQVGIVGYVTKTGKARTALDVGQDAVYFDNPDLPQTRSEVALALIAGGKILGALDIQSTQGEAFSDADVSTLQVLADQIAISIENARLFEQNRNSMQALRRAYSEQSHAGWQELAYTRKNYGFQSKGDGTFFPLTDPLDANLTEGLRENKIVLDDTQATANIPITVRGNSIGMLRLSKPDNTPSWSENELELARVLSAELSGALDSARLFDETRKQAEQEYIVGEVTNKMRETMNVESVIKMAADEIYKLLDLEEITIHFSPNNDENENEVVA